MIRTPPQHNVVNPPGQIIYTEKVDPMAFKSHPKTLGDVIDNVKLHEEQLQKKKLTFEEWCEESQIYYRDIETRADFFHYLKWTWEAAQENK